MATTTHDLVVIGAGPGGYVAAIRAAQLGLKVACVEQEPQLGGTCLRVGCIPSKAMLESSHQFSHARDDLKRHGITLAEVALDLPRMLGRKQGVVNSLAKGVEALFRKHNIARHVGHGRIEAPGRVAVEGPAELLRLEAKSVLIATGSRPASLPGIQWHEDKIGSSTEALAYAEVPKHLVVIGAGYIGLELGSVWRRLGAQVTVLEWLDRILPGMDSELAEQAHKIFAKQGLQFQLGAKVRGANPAGNGCVVEREGAEPLVCDRVLVAVGRTPNTENLGLDTVGIQLDEKGRIPVNDRFATSVDGIFAIGDVIGGPMLAHKAEEEGIAFAEMLATGHGHVDYEVIPAVVYTHPEIASVGKTEDQLKEAGTDYRKGVCPFRANGRAHTLDQTVGFIKVLASRQTDRILGIHILGPGAGDLINEAAVAMSFGASSEDLARICHAHPTLAETLREAALGVEDRSIHI